MAKTITSSQAKLLEQKGFREVRRNKATESAAAETVKPKKTTDPVRKIEGAAAKAADSAERAEAQVNRLAGIAELQARQLEELIKKLPVRHGVPAITGFTFERDEDGLATGITFIRDDRTLN